MAKRLKDLFGPNLRRLREERGLRQEELGALAHLHPTHISFLEGGKRHPRLDTLERLAKALRVQPSALLPDITLPR